MVEAIAEQLLEQGYSYFYPFFLFSYIINCAWFISCCLDSKYCHNYRRTRCYLCCLESVYTRTVHSVFNFVAIVVVASSSLNKRLDDRECKQITTGWLK